MWGNRKLLAVCLICVGHCFATPSLPAADVSGVWIADDSNGQYWLVLEQNGANVTGTYTLQDGQVFGSIRDGVVRLSWRQEQNRRGGSTTLTLSQDQQVLSGPWQYDPKVFNSGLSGGGSWTFHRAADDSSSPSPKLVVPSPNKSRAPTPSELVSFTFDQFTAGPLSVDAFATRGAQMTSLKGTPVVSNPGPEMVLPRGRSRVFMIGGAPVTSVTFSFDRPFKKFSLTRIGVVNGASIPTWKLEALDRNGRVLDSVGEIHGLYQQPRKVSVQGISITDVRLSTDNRSGAGTWATYNSLPVVEFEIEGAISSPEPREKSPTPPPLVATTPRYTPPISKPTPVPKPTPPKVITASPTPVSPKATVPPLPTRTPTPALTATPTPAVKPSSPRPLPTSPATKASPSASAISTKEKPRSPQGLGKPEAVIAAVKKNPSPASGGVHDETIADGAFIVQRPDTWQVTDTTDSSAMFVSQDLPNAGVLFEWDSDKQASAESVLQLKQEHPDLEPLPDGQMGSAPAHRFAWVEAAEPERREALHVSWNARETAIHATAIAPAAAWQKYPEKILAVLNGRTGEKSATKPKPKSAPVPSEAPTPTASETPSPTPSASPTAIKAPLLTAAGAVAQSKPPAPGSGELQNKTIADGALTIHYDDSWKISDSGNSYVVLATAKPPELTIWIQWSDGKGKSLDQVANEAMAKLRARYDVIDSLLNRTIAGAPARQVAWLTSEDNQKREHLQLDWLQHDTLFRATIVAPPDVWRKCGPQILRLLEDFTEGGG
jgi:hypothetical protein